MHIHRLADRLRESGFSGRVILAHGWNVSDEGQGTTGTMRGHYEAEGFEVVEFNTGWRFLSGIRFGHKKRARQLARIIRAGDILVGHSDGCNIINGACWILAGRGATPLACIYYNPALDADTPLAPQVKGCLVFHTSRDWAVRFASWLWFHPWGRMGATGHVPPSEDRRDGRYKSVSYEHLGLHKLGHSGVFKDPEYRERTFVYTELFLQSLSVARPSCC